MSRIDHTWVKTDPPKADVYTTRRNESKYLSLRYWDGECWFEIGYTDSRGGVPFTWPKKSRTPEPKRTHWGNWRPTWVLRKIKSGVDNIQWGEPFKVYDEKEVLAWLVKTGVLPSNWKTAYQHDMRAEKGGAK